MVCTGVGIFLPGFLFFQIDLHSQLMKLFSTLILLLLFRTILAQTIDSTRIKNDSIGIKFYQEGQASYYHSKFKGRKTASGERYHPDSLTAAHLKIPLGTFVKVINAKNDSLFVIVKINDRGPYSKKFIIDLSKSAALKIGLTKSKGHIPVRIEILNQNFIKKE